jgi:hypothetical protein
MQAGDRLSVVGAARNYVIAVREARAELNRQGAESAKT